MGPQQGVGRERRHPGAREAEEATSQSKTTAEHHHLCEIGPKTYPLQPSQAESTAVSPGMGDGGRLWE